MNITNELERLEKRIESLEYEIKKELGDKVEERSRCILDVVKKAIREAREIKVELNAEARGELRFLSGRVEDLEKLNREAQ